MDSESTIEAVPRPLRLAIAGGGSGGHVSPAVSVVEELRRQGPLDAIWVGTRAEFEGRAARDLGIPFHAIKAGKLRRYFSLQTFGDAVRIPVGVVQARRILKDFRPDVVLSTGGFVSVPTVAASAMLDIPAVTHEQTAHVGLATRINARFCDVIALSFDRSAAALGRTKKRIVVTGNPVRQSVLNGDASRATAHFRLTGTLPIVYVTGGAQGARAINAVVRDALPELLDCVEIVHQCGPRTLHDDFEQLQRFACYALTPEQAARYHVHERVGSELGDLYAAAQIVVGRAGAGTIAELATLGIPSILVPLPGAKEQYENAAYLVQRGAAIVIDQSDLTPDALVAVVTRLAGDPDALSAMRQSAAQAGFPDAAARLARVIRDLAAAK